MLRHVQTGLRSNVLRTIITDGDCMTFADAPKKYFPIQRGDAAVQNLLQQKHGNKSSPTENTSAKNHKTQQHRHDIRWSKNQDPRRACRIKRLQQWIWNLADAKTFAL